MAILNKRLLLAVAIKVIINRRCRRRYDFKNFSRRFWVNPIFTRRNVSVFFVNLTEEMRKDDRINVLLRDSHFGETKKTTVLYKKILLILFSNVKLNVKNIRIFKRM